MIFKVAPHTFAPAILELNSLSSPFAAVTDDSDRMGARVASEALYVIGRENEFKRLDEII